MEYGSAYRGAGDEAAPIEIVLGEEEEKLGKFIGSIREVGVCSDGIFTYVGG